jgi:predicted RNA-binding Zn ribbon-like protein
MFAGDKGTLRVPVTSNDHPGVTCFVWVAGRPSLDLCNTRRGDVELLGTPEDLSRWIVEAGLSLGTFEVGDTELRAARSLRDALRPALVGGDGPVVAALAATWLDGVPGRLCVEQPTLRPRFRPAGATSRCALVRAVLDALELVREQPGRVRECAAEDCTAIYLDTSRNGSRRWCSMRGCGSRAKAAAYYRRHRGITPAAEPQTR